MEEYSEGEILKFFVSTVNPALKVFKVGLVERGWYIEDIQLPSDFKQDNTMTGEIWATKKGELCFSYKVLVNPISKSVSDKYYTKFEFGYCNGEVEERGLKDSYNRNINTITTDDFLEHVEMIFNEHIGMR